MIDLIYIAVTVGFFGLMLAYVHACDRLGRNTTTDTEKAP
jgi:hypothetical protein